MPSFLLSLLVLSASSGIEVSIPQKVYEVARGDNISLPCTFKSLVTGTGSASVNWAILGGTPDDPTSVRHKNSGNGLCINALGFLFII